MRHADAGVSADVVRRRAIRADVWWPVTGPEHVKAALPVADDPIADLRADFSGRGLDHGISQGRIENDARLMPRVGAPSIECRKGQLNCTNLVHCDPLAPRNCTAHAADGWRSIIDFRHLPTRLIDALNASKSLPGLANEKTREQGPGSARLAAPDRPEPDTGSPSWQVRRNHVMILAGKPPTMRTGRA